MYWITVLMRQPFSVRLALCVWALLLLGVVGRVAFSKSTAQTVMPIYLNGSHRWWNGEDLYTPHPPLDIYRNPPGFAAAFVPFTVLPEKTSGVVWRLVSAAVFLLGLARWSQQGLTRGLTRSETGWLFTLTMPLVLPSLNNGQTNLIVAGLILFGASAAATARWRSAGLWLAAAAAIKVYPLAVGLLIGLASPRRYYPWLIVGCVIAAVFPFLCQRPDYVAEMYRSLAESTGSDDRTFAPPGRAPKDAFLVMRVWFTAPPASLYLAGKLALAVGLAALVAWTARRTRDTRQVAPLALHLGCLWITVFGPATEVHTYTLLAPTAAAVLLHAVVNRHQSGGGLRLATVGIGSGLVISPILRDMFPNGTAFAGLGPQPTGGMLLLLVVIVDAIISNVQWPRAQRSQAGFTMRGVLGFQIRTSTR